MIDWSVRLGDVISFLGFAAGALSFVWIMKGDIRVLTTRVGYLEGTVKRETEAQNKKIDRQSEEIGKFGELLALMGRYEERFLGLQRQLDEMKHGRGFVVNRPSD